MTAEQATALQGTEPWFKTDEYLVPVLESDPLIRALCQFCIAPRTAFSNLFLEVSNDDWSDSEDEDAATSDPAKRSRILEKNLALAQAKIAEYQKLLYQRLDIGGTEEIKGKVRDDDTHYFDSYAENGEGNDYTTHTTSH